MSEKKNPFSELSQLGDEALNLLRTAKRVAENSKAADKAMEVVSSTAKELERAFTNVASAAEAEWKKHARPPSAAPDAGPPVEASKDEAKEPDVGSGI